MKQRKRSHIKYFPTPIIEGQYGVVPARAVPSHIQRPSYLSETKPIYGIYEGAPVVHNYDMIQKLRKAAQIAAQTAYVAQKSVKQGMTTDDLDKIVHEFIISQNAYPSPIGFMGFPKSVCTSVNEVCCHGIPNLRPLDGGDSLNIDVTIFYDGVHGDTSVMAQVPDMNPEITKLIDTTQKALYEAIKICKPGQKFSKIGDIVEEVAADEGFTVCELFTGHGIGELMHMPPTIIHNFNDYPGVMVPGNVFTIEPILLMRHGQYSMWKDNFTVVSPDNPSAQWEHMVLITENGYEVLTKREDETVSLQDFGFHQPNAPEVNTPRSLEACRREGISPNEIVKVSFEEYQKKYRLSNLDAKGIETYYKHFEEKREEKYRDLIKQRHIVLEDEKTGLWSPDGLGKSKMISKYSQQDASSLIEKEKQQIEKIKKKQQKEIENMLEFELKIQEIKEQNEKKMQEERTKQKQRELELERKRAQQEEIKRQKELQKQQKKEQEEEALKERMKLLESKEQERIKQEELKQKLRDEENKRKEDEKKAQQEKLRKLNEENIRLQLEALEKRKKEMDEKAEQRKKMMEEQKEKKKQEAEKARIENEERIKQAKERNEQEVLRVKEDVEKKLQISEQKRLQFEEEKRKKLEQQKIEAEQHAEIIRKVIEQNEQMELEKKKEYLKKIDEAEERRKQLEKEQEREKEKRRQEDHEKEQQRHQVLLQNEQRQKERIEEFLKKFQDKDENLQKIQFERSILITDKRNQDTLKRIDKRDNVERIMKKQEYDRMKLQEKLNEKMERADKIQEDLEQLLLQRQNMRREIDKQKRDLLLKLEKIREGKIPQSEIQKQFGITSTDLKSQTHEEQNFARKSQSQSINKNNKKLMTLTKPFSTIRSSKGQDKLPEINSSSPQLKETLNNPLNTKSVESAQQLLQQQPQSQKKSPKRAKKQDIVKQKPTEPPSPEVLFELNQIIQRQNQEIMRVFMEEQANENRRDDKLRNCKSENRAKLEKLQSLERQKAQQRIQKLQEQHQYEQYQFKLAHNLIG